jgi:hypothetical protein
MDNITRFHIAGSRDDRLSRRASPLPLSDGPAFLQYRGSAGTVNGAVNTAAAHQVAVRRIDDSVDFQLCYVSL